jgi:polyisoprenoid-binding protein YceI
MKLTIFAATLLGAAMALANTRPVSGSIQWTGTGVGKAHTGTLKVTQGSITMKGKDVVGGEFTMDMNTIDYKNAKLVGHLKSPDFFEVSKFPTAKFVAKSVTALKGDASGATHQVSGDLTIRDQTHPIAFKVKISEAGDQLRAQGDIVIEDRTKYGIKYNSKKVFDVAKLGDKLIEDEIKLSLDVSTSK